MKSIILIFLFLLGLFELFLPIQAGLRRYAFEPQFRKAFDVAHFTTEQQQVCRQYKLVTTSDWNTVFYCGLTTVALVLLFLLADRKKSPAA